MICIKQLIKIDGSANTSAPILPSNSTGGGKTLTRLPGWTEPENNVKPVEKSIADPVAGAGAGLSVSSKNGSALGIELPDVSVLRGRLDDAKANEKKAKDKMNEYVDFHFGNLDMQDPAILEGLKADYAKATEAREKAELNYYAHEDSLEDQLEGVGKTGRAISTIIAKPFLAADVIAQTAKHAANGEEMDMNTVAMQKYGRLGETRENITEGMSGVGKFLTDTAMGIGDTLYSLPLNVIVPGASMASAGARSAADKMYNLGEQGESSMRALVRGIISGGIDFGTEGLPLAHLAKLIKSGGKSVVKSMLAQSGIEATEEGIAYIANYIADKLAKDPNAKWSWPEFLTAIGGGGLSGLFFGFGGSMVGKARGNTGNTNGKVDTNSAETVANVENTENAVIAQISPDVTATATTQTEDTSGKNLLPGAVEGDIGSNLNLLPGAIRPNQKLNIDNAGPTLYNNAENGGAVNGAQLHGTFGEGLRDDVFKSDSLVPGRWNLGSGDLRDVGVIRLSNHSQNILNERGVVDVELFDSSMDNAAFSSALEAARTADEKNGWAVSPQSESDLSEKAVRTYLSQDGAAGFGITRDGDIIGVFSNKAAGAPKGTLRSMMPKAIAAGGKKLDCYGLGLARLYEQYGFIPVATVEFNPEYANPGWTQEKGTPAVYVMIHNGDSADAVVEKMNTYTPMTEEELAALRHYGSEEYDKAIDYRDEMISGSSKSVDGFGQNTVGAAQAQFPYQQAPSQSVADRLFTEEELDKYNLRSTHEVYTNAQAVQDADNLLNEDYTGEVERLQNDNTTWGKTENVEGHKILEDLIAKARETGSTEDWQVVKDWKNVYDQKGGTENAQALQGRALFADSTATIVSDAAIELDGKNVKKLTDAKKREILDNIYQQAEVYNSLKDGDTDAVIKLIKQNSEIRRTNGLFSKNTSKALDSAMNYIAENYSDGYQFLRGVALSQINSIATDYNRVSFTQGLKTTRINNLLSKFSTIARNIVGNNVFDPLESLSNNVGIVADQIMSLATGKRTTTVDKSWLSSAKRKGSVEGALKSFVQVSLDAQTELAQITAATQNAKQAEIAPDGKIKPGTVVKARDRNNYGKIVSYNEADDTYLVHFVSKSGHEANVSLKSSNVEVPGASIDAKKAATTGQTSTKYEGIGGGRTFKMTGNLIERFFSTWEKYTAYALQTTDEFQKGGIAAETQRQIETLKDRGLLPKEDLNEWATETARQRTFQNDSNISKAVGNVRNAANQAIHVGELGAGDVLIPFAKVPSNIGAQVINYSPAGVVNGIRQMAQVMIDAKRGTVTAEQQAQAARNIGRGLNGSALLAAFAALALKGIIDVADSEDPDKNALEKAQGKTGTQWNISATLRALSGESVEWRDDDLLMSIGFLDPINAIMATASLLADEIKDDKKLTVGEFAGSTFGGLYQAVMDLPAMSSISSLINSISYAEGETDGWKFVNGLADYGTSQLPSFLIPNALRGIATGTDNTMRNQYASQNVIGSTVDAFKSGIPGLRKTLPASLDPFGREKTQTGNPVLNFVNNNILPGAITRYKETEVEKLISDVYEHTKESGVYPDKSAPKTISYQNETYKLTPDDKDAYLKIAGQEAVEIISGLYNSDMFRNATYEEKANYIKLANSYSRALADREVTDGKYQLSGVNKSIDNAVKNGMPAADYIVYYANKSKYDADGNSKYTNAEKVNAVKASGLKGEKLTSLYAATFPEWVEGARKRNVDFEQYLDYKLSTMGATTKAEKIKALVSAGYSNAEATAIYSKMD